MAVDTIKKYGKKALVAESLEEKLSDPSSNVALEIYQLDELDRVDAQAFADLYEQSLRFTPLEHKRVKDEYVARNAPLVINEVMANVPEAVDAITKDEVLRPYLVSRKPVQYDGVDESIFKAHKEAHESRSFLTSEQAVTAEAGKRIKKTIDNLKEKKINGAIIDAIQRMYSDPRTVIARIQAEAIEKQKAFDGIERGKLVSYVLGRYEALNDKDKKSEAYEIGKAVARC